MTDERLEEIRAALSVTWTAPPAYAPELLAEVDRLRARECFVLFGKNSSCDNTFLGVVLGTIDDARREAEEAIEEHGGDPTVLIYRETSDSRELVEEVEA